MRRLLAAALLVAAPAFAGEPAAPGVSLPPMSPSAVSVGRPQLKAVDLPLIPLTPGECPALPRPRSGPPPFPAGEALGYDVDVMGMRAGKMDFLVLPSQGKGAAAEIPVRVQAESNTFFNKVRKIKAELYSYLKARDLRPRRFTENLSEGEARRLAEVEFLPTDRQVVASWSSNFGNGGLRQEVANDALDYVGAIYLFRALPLRVGQPFCFEVYALKKLWRLTGKVEAKEQLSTPAGVFNTFHLSGTAVMLGSDKKREVHVWISDDAQRLPVAAMGVIDLGPVRAVLTSLSRPDHKPQGQGSRKMDW